MSVLISIRGVGASEEVYRDLPAYLKLVVKSYDQRNPLRGGVFTQNRTITPVAYVEGLDEIILKISQQVYEQLFTYLLRYPIYVLTPAGSFDLVKFLQGYIALPNLDRPLEQPIVLMDFLDPLVMLEVDLSRAMEDKKTCFTLDEYDRALGFRKEAQLSLMDRFGPDMNFGRSPRIRDLEGFIEEFLNLPATLPRQSFSGILMYIYVTQKRLNPQMDCEMVERLLTIAKSSSYADKL